MRLPRPLSDLAARLAGRFAAPPRQRLDPHFLFNSLNAVRALIEERPAAARRLVTQIAEHLRWALDPGRDREARLSEEIDAIRNYLAIQKTRFEGNLDVAIETDPGTGDAILPGFLLHPLVESAVIQGMETGAMPLRIRVRARAAEDRVELEVASTGRLRLVLPGRRPFQVVEEDGWVRAVIELKRTPAREDSYTPTGSR